MPPPPPFLADQLTLSQQGGQIMPTTLLRAPPEFSDLPTALCTICNGWKRRRKPSKLHLVDTHVSFRNI